MHINKHVQICLGCGHIHTLTDSSIPLTRNYMYVSIDTDMHIDRGLHTRIPESLPKPS